MRTREGYWKPPREHFLKGLRGRCNTEGADRQTRRARRWHRPPRRRRPPERWGADERPSSSWRVAGHVVREKAIGVGSAVGDGHTIRIGLFRVAVAKRLRRTSRAILAKWLQPRPGHERAVFLPRPDEALVHSRNARNAVGLRRPSRDITVEGREGRPSGKRSS